MTDTKEKKDENQRRWDLTKISDAIGLSRVSPEIIDPTMLMKVKNFDSGLCSLLDLFSEMGNVRNGFVFIGKRSTLFLTFDRLDTEVKTLLNGPYILIDIESYQNMYDNSWILVAVEDHE
jgi:hypothetical protein